MVPAIDETHDPQATSWVASAAGHRDFPLQNLPLGIFDPGDGVARAGAAIGDCIVDLAALARLDLVPRPAAAALGHPSLNALLALGPGPRRALRRRLSQLLAEPAQRSAVEPLVHPAGDCAMRLPAAIGDYSDFYVGIHHATNVGRLLRPDNPLLANYRHVPIGYHGRSSSIRLSGEPVVRPSGQRKPADSEAPVFGPTQRLDHEVELGLWIGPGNALGRPIPIAQAGDHVAGLCLLNDWSARDIQAWEYQPLGPFLAKNFHTSISPWLITAEALAPFRIAQPPRGPGEPQPLAYLLDRDDQQFGALAITLEAHLLTAAMRSAGLPPHRLSRAAASNMYWTPAQIVAHHSSGGCNLRPGDLLGSGTISGPGEEEWGSLMEISRAGRQPLALPGGETRAFLEDDDELILTGRAEAQGRIAIGLGECRAQILAAR